MNSNGRFRRRQHLTKRVTMIGRNQRLRCPPCTRTAMRRMKYRTRLLPQRPTTQLATATALCSRRRVLSPQPVRSSVQFVVRIPNRGICLTAHFTCSPCLLRGQCERTKRSCHLRPPVDVPQFSVRPRWPGTTVHVQLCRRPSGFPEADVAVLDLTPCLPAFLQFR